MKNKILNILAARLRLPAWLSLAAFLLGQTVNFWFTELFSHFLPYFAAVFALAIWVDTAWRRGLWAACTAASLAWLLWPPPDFTAEPRGTLLWYNVHLDNADPAAETERILARLPETLALAELNPADPRWQRLRQAYPHGCQHLEYSPFSLAVWSRQPLAECELRFTDDTARIRARLANGTVVYALHPPPPINGELAHTRTRYLDEAAREIAAETGRVLAVGDFNSSAFSPVLREFAAVSGLTAHTPNYLPTWKPFFLGIDHVFAAKGGAAAEALAWVASDHRPLLVRY